RLRRRRRGAPAAGNGGGRRTSVFPVGDPLPHARLLHLHVRAPGPRKRLERPWQEGHAPPGIAGGWVEATRCVLRGRSVEGPPLILRLPRRAHLPCPLARVSRNSRMGRPSPRVACSSGCSPSPGTRFQALSSCWYRDFSL